MQTLCTATISLDQFGVLHDRAKSVMPIHADGENFRAFRIADHDGNEVVAAQVDAERDEIFMLVSTAPVQFDLNLPDLDLTSQL